MGGIIQKESLSHADAPQRRQAMVIRDDVRNAGLTEGRLGCEAAIIGGNMNSDKTAADMSNICRLKRLNEGGGEPAPTVERAHTSGDGADAPAPQENATKRVRFAQPTRAVNSTHDSTSSSSFSSSSSSFYVSVAILAQAILAQE